MYRCVHCGRITDESATTLSIDEKGRDIRYPKRHYTGSRNICPGVKEPAQEIEVIVKRKS